MTGGITGASIPPVFLSAGKGHRLIFSTAINCTIFEGRTLGVGFLQSLGDLLDMIAKLNDAGEVVAGSG